MVNRFERFSYFISELSRLLHKIESDEMEAIGLKGPHSIYLIVLSKYEDGITSTKLAQICGKDKADVSRAVSTLCAKGLVNKVAGSNNNYRAPLFLTEEGKTAANRLKEKAKLAVEYASRGVSDEDRAALYRSLETICTNVQELCEAGLPDCHS